jgi:hypothetical protein
MNEQDNEPVDSATDNPAGFGWVARLMRFSRNDVTVRGLDGPLIPQQRKKADGADRADDFDQALIFGSANGMLGLIGGSLQQFFNEPRQRHDLYRIYDMMDKTELPGTVLDLSAEEATHLDVDTQRALWITSEDKEMVRVGEEMLRRLKVEEEITGQARDIAKYGDNFERTVYSAGKGKGVYRLIPQHPTEMMRKENKYGRLEGYTQNGKKFRSQASDISYPWDYVHMRLRGQDRYFGYGTSILKNAIRPWRQLSILEEWQLHYQVSKAPSRNLLLVDVGGSSEVDASEVQRRLRQKLKRHMFVDPAGASGSNLAYQFNAVHPNEDMVMAVRNESKTRIEKFNGSADVIDIAPMMLLIDKFFAAVRAPKGFFGFADPTGQSNIKANLCAQDIKFARRAKAIQMALRVGYTWLLELHYTLQMSGNPEDHTYDFMDKEHAFHVHMAAISFLEELERLEVMQIRQQVAMALNDMSRENAAYKSAEWTAWLLRDIIKVPKAELKRVLNNADELRAAQTAIMNAKAANVNTPPQAGIQANIKMQQKQLDLQKDQMALSAVPQPEEIPEEPEESRNADIMKRIEDEVGRARADGNQHDGSEMTKDDKIMLSEAIKTNPALRDAIHHGAMLFREDGESLEDTGGMILPDRDNELFKKGLLEDEVTQADIDRAFCEAVIETGKAGS